MRTRLTQLSSFTSLSRLGMTSWRLSLVISVLLGSTLAAAAPPDDEELPDGIDVRIRRNPPGTQGKAVTALAFSPDGKRLASASREGPTQVWDVSTGKLLQTLPAEGNGGLALAWAPDGTRLATSNCIAAKIWELASGKLLKTTKVPGCTGAMTWVSGEGPLALIELGQKVLLWDAVKGTSKEVFKARAGTNLHLGALAPDAHTALICTGGEDGPEYTWYAVNLVKPGKKDLESSAQDGPAAIGPKAGQYVLVLPTGGLIAAGGEESAFSELGMPEAIAISAQGKLAFSVEGGPILITDLDQVLE